MKRLWMASIAVGFAGMATMAQAEEAPKPTSSEQARLLLGAIDIFLTAENIAQAGLTEAFAQATLRNTTSKRYLRMRSLGALGLIGTQTARAALRNTARRDPDPYVQRQAVNTLAFSWGATHPASVTTLLLEIRENAPPLVSEEIRTQLERLKTVSRPAGAPNGAPPQDLRGR